MKTIQVTDTDHKRIKLLATHQGISIMATFNKILDVYKGVQLEHQHQEKKAS